MFYTPCYILNKHRNFCEQILNTYGNINISKVVRETENRLGPFLGF